MRSSRRHHRLNVRYEMIALKNLGTGGSIRRSPCYSGVDMAIRFSVGARDPGSRARRGRLETRRGTVETPLFMPVGTRATVTGLSPDDLRTLGAPIILANTYHLLLRPGPELFRRVGGIHSFMRWPGPVLTDSGGYQIFSLPGDRTISEA